MIENGTILIGVFIIVSNFSAVISSMYLQAVDPGIMLFWAFLITQIVFVSVNLRIENRKIEIAARDIALLAAINIVTAANWLVYFVSLKYLEPAIVIGIKCGTPPILMILLGTIWRKQQIPPYLVISALGAFAGTATLVVGSMTGTSGLHTITSAASTLGLIAAVVGGVMQVATIAVIQRLGRAHWTSGQIMAHRFYAVIGMGLVWTWLNGRFLPVSQVEVVSIGLLAVLGVIIPLWVLQAGLIRANPIVASVLLTVGPVVTYLTQFIDQRISWSAVTAAGCCIIVVATAYGVFKDGQNTRRLFLASATPTGLDERRRAEPGRG